MTDRSTPSSSLDYQAILQLMPDSCAILNPQFIILEVNKAYLDATMMQREDIIGHNIFEVFPDNPSDPQATGVNNLRNSLERVLNNKTSDTMAIQKHDIRLPKSVGGKFEERYWSTINTPLLGSKSEVQYIIHCVQDITDFIHHKYLDNTETDNTEETEIFYRTQEIQQTNQKLHKAVKELVKKKREILNNNHKLLESEERFRLAFNFAAIGMALVSLEGKWIKVNKSICDLVGYSEEELLNTDFQKITHPEDLESDLNFAKQLLDGEIPSYQMEKRYFHKNGNIIWVLLSISLVRDTNGSPLYYIAQIQDINRQKQAEGQLIYQASHDVLTGLLNRGQFECHLEKTLAEAKARNDKRLIAVLFLDLDHFKKINDTLGHLAGDQILSEVAWRLSKVLRKDDIIARFGGDEFTILLSYLSTKSDVAFVAEKLLHTISKPYQINNDTIYLGSSIGIACYPDASDNLIELLRKADLALLQAKESGKGTFEFYSEKIAKMHETEFMLEKALHQAIIKKEFFLMYQPKFELRTRKIVGLEALIRWKHPELGLLMPNQFIPAAERSGLIILIGQWVIETAFHQLLHWRNGIAKESDFTIAINLSPRQLKNKTFLNSLNKLLHDTKLPAKYFEFELTERAVMHTDSDDPILKNLKDLSIQLVIDDFGIGYSSLERLKVLPINSIKIDRSFVKGIDDIEGNKAVIKSIIMLGKELGVTVIAEGIETESQYNFLRDQGCPQGQGFYLSKPLELEQMTELLTHQLT